MSDQFSALRTGSPTYFVCFLLARLSGRLMLRLCLGKRNSRTVYVVFPLVRFYRCEPKVVYFRGFFSFPFRLCMTYFKIHRPVSAGFYMMFDPRLPQILSPVAIILRTLRPMSTSFLCQLCQLCLARDVDGSCYFLAMRVSASWVSSMVGFSEPITGFSQQERSDLRRPCLLTNVIIIGNSNIVDGRNLCARFYGSLLDIRSHGANLRFLYVASVLLWHWPVVVRISSLLLPHRARLLLSHASVWLLHSPPAHLMRRAHLVGFSLFCAGQSMMSGPRC